jgi:tritrans,polycis-undecaprenyl-diphosphate synthase [geranylgeranyl-diphosphate specific]
MEDENTPEHIAIILDGNRRFAKRLMLEPWKGHEYGRKKVDELLSYAKDFGIKEMTFYALSVENIKSRPEKELSFLYNIFRDMFKGMDMDNVEKNEIRLKFIGKLDLLPSDLREMCFKLEKDTMNNSKFIVNFCVAYGGRQELVEAVKNILKNKVNAEDVNEDLIQDNLYLKSEPDMIIRTGGEKRSSNFLPWQSGYSEWFFLEKMWPEFEKEDLAECIEGFKNRKRNFGK